MSQLGRPANTHLTVVGLTVYQSSDQSGQCVCRQRPLDGFDLPQSTETGRQHVVDVGLHRHGSIDVHAQVSDRLNRMNWVVADYYVRGGNVAASTRWGALDKLQSLQGYSCSLLLRVQLKTPALANASWLTLYFMSSGWISNNALLFSLLLLCFLLPFLANRGCILPEKSRPQKDIQVIMK